MSWTTVYQPCKPRNLRRTEEEPEVKLRDLSRVRGTRPGSWSWRCCWVTCEITVLACMRPAGFSCWPFLLSWGSECLSRAPAGSTHTLSLGARHEHGLSRSPLPGESRLAELRGHHQDPCCCPCAGTELALGTVTGASPVCLGQRSATGVLGCREQRWEAHHEHAAGPVSLPLSNSAE